MNFQNRKRLTDFKKELLAARYEDGEERVKDDWGAWEEHGHTGIFKMDNQQGPIV